MKFSDYMLVNGLHNVADAFEKYYKDFILSVSSAYENFIPTDFVCNYLQHYREHVVCEIQKADLTHQQRIHAVERLTSHLFKSAEELIKIKTRDHHFESRILRFSEKPVGVGIRSALVLSPSKSLDLGEIYSYQYYDDMRLPKVKDKVLAHIKKFRPKDLRLNISDLFSGFCSEKVDCFHAESAWLATYLANLINLLKDFKKGGFKEGKKQKPVDFERNKEECLALDEHPVAMLQIYPRLEFMISSECCENCIKYFQDIRRMLTALKMHLPIVIFGDYPFNAVSVKHSSPLKVIDFKGKVQTLDLFIDTLYNKDHFFKNNKQLSLKSTDEMALERGFYAVSASIALGVQKEFLDGLMQLLQQQFCVSSLPTPNPAILWLDKKIQPLLLLKYPSIVTLEQNIKNALAILHKKSPAGKTLYVPPVFIQNLNSLLENHLIKFNTAESSKYNKPLMNVVLLVTLFYTVLFLNPFKKAAVPELRSVAPPSLH